MPPDMRAETFEGAAGCACGSHEWNGNMPALQPKPQNARMKHRLAIAGLNCVARNVANSKLPVLAAMIR